jgi:F-type H+-transporting ATPase subunit b
MLASFVAFAAAAAHAAEAKSGLPQLNAPDFAPQLIWLALSFGALYILLSWIALPGIAQVLEDRRLRIDRDLKEAARLKEETQKALATYEDALATARAKATAIAKETRDKLAAEIDAERGRVESQITAKIAEAEGRIGATKDKALAQVNDIARETAEAIVTKLIGGPVGADEVRRALEPVPGE